jgi:hypothetical protein
MTIIEIPIAMATESTAVKRSATGFQTVQPCTWSTAANRPIPALARVAPKTSLAEDPNSNRAGCSDIRPAHHHDHIRCRKCRSRCVRLSRFDPESEELDPRSDESRCGAAAGLPTSTAGGRTYPADYA